MGTAPDGEPRRAPSSPCPPRPAAAPAGRARPARLRAWPHAAACCLLVLTSVPTVCLTFRINLCFDGPKEHWMLLNLKHIDLISAMPEPAQRRAPSALVCDKGHPLVYGESTQTGVENPASKTEVQA
jgi:hypothetical protein|tara:strand:+ start:564 stop:944 length:381 start_codon:yes stop_codon:yes gene_type:complete